MDSLKQQIVGVCQEMDRRQFVANHDGNVSRRLSENRFLATPTSFAKRAVHARDLLLIDLEGQVVEGVHRVFSEWRIHRAIYEICGDATSVCHAHSPFATAWGLTGKQIEFPSIPEAIVSLGGPLMTTEFISPTASHAEIKDAVMSAIQNCYAFLIPGNGVFAVGDDPDMAYLRLELVEQVIRAHAIALQMGSTKSLPRDLVRDLQSKRPPLKPAWKKESSPDIEASLPKTSSILVEAKSEPKPDQVREIIRSEIEKFLKV
jgi:L-fuculose-phosphate aldolase